MGTGRKLQTCGWNEIYCSCYIAKSLCSHPGESECIMYNYTASVFGDKENERKNLEKSQKKDIERINKLLAIVEREKEESEK